MYDLETNNKTYIHMYIHVDMYLAVLPGGICCYFCSIYTNVCTPVVCMYVHKECRIVIDLRGAVSLSSVGPSVPNARRGCVARPRPAAVAWSSAT